MGFRTTKDTTNKQAIMQTQVLIQQQRSQIIGYEMTGEAWCWVVILLLVCWPLAWLPCVMDSCKRPIYAAPQVAVVQRNDQYQAYQSQVYVQAPTVVQVQAQPVYTTTTYHQN
eukprot:c10870_g1_i1.p1 GENE.c10870_g1_i1~~c10870_g1_i1.p1  ORF type:complete len:113 (+),score=36.74 c10870_g1_i1:1-339(+)